MHKQHNRNVPRTHYGKGASSTGWNPASSSFVFRKTLYCCQSEVSPTHLAQCLLLPHTISFCFHSLNHTLEWLPWHTASHPMPPSSKNPIPATWLLPCQQENKKWQQHSDPSPDHGGNSNPQGSWVGKSKRVSNILTVTHCLHLEIWRQQPPTPHPTNLSVSPVLPHPVVCEAQVPTVGGGGNWLYGRCIVCPVDRVKRWRLAVACCCPPQVESGSLPCLPGLGMPFPCISAVSVVELLPFLCEKSVK